MRDLATIKMYACPHCSHVEQLVHDHLSRDNGWVCIGVYVNGLAWSVVTRPWNRVDENVLTTAIGGTMVPDRRDEMSICNHARLNLTRDGVWSCLACGKDFESLGESVRDYVDAMRIALPIHFPATGHAQTFIPTNGHASVERDDDGIVVLKWEPEAPLGGPILTIRMSPHNAMDMALTLLRYSRTR